MKYKVITKKNNLRKLAKLAKKLSKATSEYGYFKEQGNHASGLSFATLMAIHEFGTMNGNIPARKPFAISLFLNKEKLFKFTLNTLKKHVMAAANTDFVPLEHTLMTFGSRGVKYTRGLFGSSALLENKQPIRKRSGKKTNSPLVDFGELKKNMAYRSSENKEIKT